MTEGSYHRDLWGSWWYQRSDGAWFRHDGVGWTVSLPPHPWYLVAPPLPPPARPSRSWALGGVGAVALVLVVVLVAALLESTAGTAGSEHLLAPADAAVVRQVTSIPASVFDQVGSSSVVPVNQPSLVSGHPALRVDGKPGIFFFGAEFCPYCAAERWAVVAALARFGTWQGLRNMVSSASDVDPDTATFTFRSARFTSPYIGFESDESVDRSDRSLQSPTPSEVRLLSAFNVTGYPFLDIGNRVIVNVTSFDPGVLAGRSRSQIAAALDDPSTASTQAIVVTANYLSAGVCLIDGQRPQSVCDGAAVAGAESALGVRR